MQVHFEEKKAKLFNITQCLQRCLLCGVLFLSFDLFQGSAPSAGGHAPIGFAGAAAAVTAFRPHSNAAPYPGQPGGGMPSAPPAGGAPYPGGSAPYPGAPPAAGAPYPGAPGQAAAPYPSAGGPPQPSYPPAAGAPPSSAPYPGAPPAAAPYPGGPPAAAAPYPGAPPAAGAPYSGAPPAAAPYPGASPATGSVPPAHGNYSNAPAKVPTAAMAAVSLGGPQVCIVPASK